EANEEGMPVAPAMLPAASALAVPAQAAAFANESACAAQPAKVRRPAAGADPQDSLGWTS
ncbi:hypothetical protein NYZ34_20120, partial [Acinetobacter baumannii]|nr:hypothetical protein [Acinetobacter baumannii]